MDDLVYREGLYYEKFTDVRFTGEIDEGLKRGLFKNGKKEGSWEYYFENGQLWKKGDYKNGKKEGLWVRHLSNGQLISKGTYKNDREDGDWVSYTVDGEVFLGLTGNYKNGVKVSD
jgi:antitoxin component YwqK of YwqJK toxin-antitoxin module